MTNENKATALQALENMRGDNLHRAQAAFRNCTPEQMAQEYGRSGKTRAEILAECEAHENRVNLAIAWIKAAP